MIDPINFLDKLNALHQYLIKFRISKQPSLFWQHYDQVNPKLRKLEESHEAIRKECEQLIKNANKITNVEDLAGKYTEGGIHSIEWKSYLLKAGKFVKENCHHCPETYRVLSEIPGIHLAFFSILFPKQYIAPHFGYYKGFLRYHLGVIIPKQNKTEKQCWLRVNDNPEDNISRDIETIVKGKKYFWEEGEGVIFDDTLLHDAMNSSDQVRVILWIDIQRPMVWPFDSLHGFLIKAAMKHPLVGKIRKNATIKGI